VNKFKIKNLILDILFPRRCVECKREGQYICEKCELFITESLNNIDNLTSVWEYNGIIQKALKEVKYRYTKDILNELIERAFKIILNNEDEFSDFLSFMINEKPVITYVPIYRKKEKNRGFNQSEIIAKKIGEIFDLKVVKLLEKARETQSQTKLNRGERLRNVQSSVTNTAAFDTELSNISSVLLVDDIWTTGATMGECEKILKQNGIQKLWKFTLAKTV